MIGMKGIRGTLGATVDVSAQIGCHNSKQANYSCVIFYVTRRGILPHLYMLLHFIAEYIFRINMFAIILKRNIMYRVAD